MMIGNISMDPALMAGVGLGNMTKQIFGTTILYGVNGSIETFICQALGAREYKLAGVYLN